jgi:thiol-disulfide isomerase/thioredoxin
MKLKFFYSSILLVLFSCGNDKTTIEDNPDTPLVENFRIIGTIEGASNQTLHLEAMSQQGTIAVAECKTDGNGEFDMIGNVPDMGVFQLRLGEGQDKIITLPLIPKDVAKLTTNIKEYQTNPVFEGTEWASGLSEYMNLFSKFVAQQQSLAALQGKVSEDELMKKYISLRKPIDSFCRNEINKDLDNPINFLLTSFLTPNMGFQDWDLANLETLKKMSSAYLKRFKDSPIANNMAQQILQIENSYNQYKRVNSGSQIAPEISLNNPDGKEIKLSSLRGQYVLIDFWASWCAPCRKELPNVVKLYNQYKSKGFTIYSVSLDKDISAWKKAIQDDNLSWPNHVSDLLGWESELPTLYGFQGIPHTVLIDKEGKIIESGLRGESLEQKLKELFKN